MHYTVWNKQDNIKGLDAQYFIDNLKIQDSDGVFLVYKNGNLQAIEIDRIIKGVYNLDENLTTEEVAQEYIRIKNDGNQTSEKDQNVLDEYSKKINLLNTQNANLLLANAKKEIEINTLNKNLANVTLEVAKIKGGM